MANLIDLSRLPPHEFLVWLKNPNNIFTGNMMVKDKPYYSNTFSQFEKSPSAFLDSVAVTNINVLFGKNIGYITPGQKDFATMLLKLITSCLSLASKHIRFLGHPVDDYSTTFNRIWKSQAMSSAISVYTNMKNGKQCLDESSEICITKDLAQGCFGSVHLGQITGIENSFTIAIKKTIEKMSKASIEHAYDPKYEAWDEINILKPYLNSLVERGICPNVPYTYTNLICNTCDFVLTEMKKVVKTSVPCSTILMELASGTLLNWKPVSTVDQYACIFQCMAGLHAIQKYFQLTNRDIKSVNILYTKCIPGGYWEYVVQGTTYYIPNFGGVFTLNDYGIGKCFDLSLPICYVLAEDNKTRTAIKSGGYRPFIVVNGVLTPIKYNTDNRNFYLKSYNNNVTPAITLPPKSNTTLAKISPTGPGSPYSVSLTPEQTRVLGENNIPTDATRPEFFSDSSIVPFIDMYIDTQDMIRMFYGQNADRTTQDGPHISFGIDESITRRLAKYIFPVRNLEGKRLNAPFLTPENLIAGYFISGFFKGMFSEKPGGPLLQRFVI